jgi:hypothetical protein
MWLLNTTTLKLHSFFENIPDYVILSHTWGQGEVAFEDIAQSYAQTMAGYDKIAGCCRLAVNDGFEWAWIDTCCIDKRSSAELSEAINSMYKWYWDAAICYAYLPDVSVSAEWKDQLEKSRWFTRGWTLQELLAPDVVELYDTQWSLLGTKAKLIDIIASVTKIDPKFILSRETIERASIGTKFSWTAARQTTRTEDMAYCMLGIMRINMPMLYGEGERAFYRLQLEVIRQTNDHSIFAWESIQSERQITTLLAPSPTYFGNSVPSQASVLTRPLESSSYEITNNGLRATMPIVRVDQFRLIALLDCKAENGNTIGIWLEAIADGRYQRLSGARLVTMSADEVEDAELLSMYLVIKNEHEAQESDTFHELVISDVLSNRPLYITGVLISRRYKTTIVQEFTPILSAARNELQMRYLLNSITLQDGEVACIWLSAEKFSVGYFIIGLRHGRPAIRQVEGGEFFATSWSADMRTNATGVWDLASDYILARARYSVALASIWSRKKRVEGKLQWRVTIEVRHCECKHSEEAEGGILSSCICPPVCSLNPDRVEPKPCTPKTRHG